MRWDIVSGLTKIFMVHMGQMFLGLYNILFFYGMLPFLFILKQKHCGLIVPAS